MINKKLQSDFPITFNSLKSNKSLLKVVQTFLRRENLYYEVPKGIWNESFINAIHLMDEKYGTTCSQDGIFHLDAFTKLNNKVVPVEGTYPKISELKAVCKQYNIPIIAFRTLAIGMSNFQFVNPVNLNPWITFNFHKFKKLDPSTPLVDSKPCNQEQQWKIYCEAENLNLKAANLATDFGLFQIPGSLYNKLGYENVAAFANDMYYPFLQVVNAIELFKKTEVLPHFIKCDWLNFVSKFYQLSDPTPLAAKLNLIQDKVKSFQKYNTFGPLSTGQSFDDD